MNGVSSSGRSFHRSAAQAPGFSTRSASRLARSPSNQWNACPTTDRKSTRLNSSHSQISYAVVCLKKKNKQQHIVDPVEQLEGDELGDLSGDNGMNLPGLEGVAGSGLRHVLAAGFNVSRN